MKTTNRLLPLQEQQARKIIRAIDTCTLLSELETCKFMIDNFINMHRENPQAPILNSYLNGYLECKIKNL